MQTGESVARDLREATFLKIQSFSYGNLDRFTTGKLLVRLTSDASAVQRLAQVSLRIGTRAPLLMIGSLILMFNTNSRLALTMLPLLVVTLAVTLLFSMRMEPLFRQVQKRLDRLNTVLAGEYRRGAAGQGLCARRLRRRALRRSQRGFCRSNRAGHAVHGDHVAGAELFRQYRHCGGHLGGRAAGHPRRTDGGPDRGLHQLPADHHGSADHDGHALQRVGQRHASAGRINEVLDAVPEVQDAPDALPLPAKAPRRVVFENVSFHYNGTATNACWKIST